ncbi:MULTISPECIES: hypothetical protein [Mesorhizobium]|uniref:hypothetical protein n=1 Tax=Mesorhizobium TaxID=68287 RepID=UPI0010A95331|nr:MULTISPECIES: hypothetical protein [Mesorhizobium]
MSLNHEANGARHISADGSAVVQKGDNDPFEELLRSIRAATHQASPLFEDELTRLAQPDTPAPLGSTETGSSRTQTRRGSSPLSSHPLSLHTGDDLAAHLKGVAEGLELSRHAWSFVQDYFARLDAQTRHADALDTEKWNLQEEVAKLERLHDRGSKELERKSRELSIASATIADLQVELDRARQVIARADRHADQRATRFLEANVEVERLGRNLARISEQLRNEIMARQAAEQAREDVASRLAGLERAAMLLHSKVADYKLLNEQLTGKLSRQMAVQQDLQARLSTVEHERGVLDDCAAAAQERAAGLERELRSLQRRATALLVDQAVVRAAPSQFGHRAEDVAGHWHPEAEIAKLREERDAARRDCAAMKVQLADLRLRGMTDERAHARCRDENRELHHRLETLTRQDRHSGSAADDSADLERAFDELLATGELSAANDGDSTVTRKAS